jgi:hypothetical protein
LASELLFPPLHYENERHMFQTKTLLLLIYILSSAILVKAGVFYSFGLPGAEHMVDFADPAGFP